MNSHEFETGNQDVDPRLAELGRECESAILGAAAEWDPWRIRIAVSDYVRILVAGMDGSAKTPEPEAFFRSRTGLFLKIGPAAEGRPNPATLKIRSDFNAVDSWKALDFARHMHDAVTSFKDLGLHPTDDGAPGTATYSLALDEAPAQAAEIVRRYLTLPDRGLYLPEFGTPDQAALQKPASREEAEIAKNTRDSVSSMLLKAYPDRAGSV